MKGLPLTFYEIAKPSGMYVISPLQMYIRRYII